MKISLKWFGVLAAVLALAACKKQDAPKDDGDKTNPDEVIVPDKKDVTLQVGPEGSTTLTTDIEAYAEWTISADENYGWIDVTPKSGAKGKTTLTFVVDPNNADGAKERTATFALFQGQACIYDIAVIQASPEGKVHEGDLEFLQAIVAGKLLGEDTPNITDWVTASDEELTAFPGFTFDYDEGKITIVSIDGAPLVGWPEEINLPNLKRIEQRGNERLRGKMLPQSGSTPKLQYVCLAATYVTGPFPKWIAESPELQIIFCDNCDFYGALPHNWASKKLEVALLAEGRNGNFTGENPYEGDTHSPYMGYLIPASLDVILNTERSAQGDKTQMKVGGVKEGHWLGFEKGWGQVRYELFDPEAVKGDGSVWSDWRLLIGKIMNDDNTNTWAYYYTNFGWSRTPNEGQDVNYKTRIRPEMLDWDQSVADAFTAAAKAAHDAGTPIDMSQFGVVVEQHDDSIDKGTVVTVDNEFWKEQ